MEVVDQMLLNGKKSALLCPNCKKLISADERRCPYCGISSPGSGLKNNMIIKGFGNWETLIRFIIGTNVVIYLISLMLTPSRIGLSFNPFDFLSPDSGSLFRLGATGTIPIINYNKWWTLLSANYLHGSVLHILFNMMALKQIGPLVSREYGAYRMFVIFTLSGVAGFYLSYIAGVRFTIGASASVCGLIGALLFYGKTRGGMYGRIIYKQTGAWAISIFIFGLLVPGINNWGHGGGMVSGALIGMLLGYQEKIRETLLHRMLFGLCMRTTIAIVLWALVSGVFYRF